MILEFKKKEPPKISLLTDPKEICLELEKNEKLLHQKIAEVIQDKSLQKELEEAIEPVLLELGLLHSWFGAVMTQHLPLYDEDDDIDEDDPGE